MDMRPRWACPDLGLSRPEGLHLPVVGTDAQFPDCPAYYLRTAGMELPAIHLLEDGTHVGHLVSNWAFEVESGSRNIETLSPKAVHAVHLHINECASRERKLSEMRKEKRERAR